MNKFKIGGLILLFVAASSVAQYYFGPKKVVVKTEQVIKYREVKDRIVERITKPDGTVIERESEHSRTESEEHERTSKAVSPKNKDWLVGITYGLDENEYGAHVSRRILGDLYLGAYGTTNREYGLSISVNF